MQGKHGLEILGFVHIGASRNLDDGRDTSRHVGLVGGRLNALTSDELVSVHRHVLDDARGGISTGKHLQVRRTKEADGERLGNGVHVNIRLRTAQSSDGVLFAVDARGHIGNECVGRTGKTSHGCSGYGACRGERQSMSLLSVHLLARSREVRLSSRLTALLPTSSNDLIRNGVVGNADRGVRENEK